MIRKCGKCGIPAPDDEAMFCNRCGSAIVEEPDFPVCPSCGVTVTDEKAGFCNRCGSPVRRKPVVCPACGNPALDGDSQFCTRCGTHFGNGKAAVLQKGKPAEKPDAQPVVVTPRRKAPQKPPVPEPVPDWDPWSEEDKNAEEEIPAPQTPRKKYGHLPLVADEPARPSSRQTDQQISVGPGKKYAHLPLIADELKEKGPREDSRYDEPDPFGSSGKGRKPPQKKGMMGLFRK